MALNNILQASSLSGTCGIDNKSPYAYWSTNQYTPVSNSQLSALVDGDRYVPAITLPPSSYTAIDITLPSGIFTGLMRFFVDPAWSTDDRIIAVFPTATTNYYTKVISFGDTTTYDRQDVKGSAKYWYQDHGAYGHFEERIINIDPGSHPIAYEAPYFNPIDFSSYTSSSDRSNQSVRQLISSTQITAGGDAFKIKVRATDNDLTINNTSLLLLNQDNITINYSNVGIQTKELRSDIDIWVLDSRETPSHKGHFEGKPYFLDPGYGITGVWREYISWSGSLTEINSVIPPYSSLRQAIPRDILESYGDGFRLKLQGGSSDAPFSNISFGITDNTWNSASNKISRFLAPNLGYFIYRWVQFYNTDGDFENNLVNFDWNSNVILIQNIDIYSNIIGIPASGHGFNAGDYIDIYGTQNYDGGPWNVLAGTTQDIIYLSGGTFYPETLASGSYACERSSIGGAWAKHPEIGVASHVDFGFDSVDITEIDKGSYGNYVSYTYLDHAIDNYTLISGIYNITMQLESEISLIIPEVAKCYIPYWTGQYWSTTLAVAPGLNTYTTVDYLDVAAPYKLLSVHVNRDGYGNAIYFSVSFDGRNTYQTYRGGWLPVVSQISGSWSYMTSSGWMPSLYNDPTYALQTAMYDLNNCMTTEYLEGLGEIEWNSSGGFTENCEYLDFGIALSGQGEWVASIAASGWARTPQSSINPVILTINNTTSGIIPANEIIYTDWFNFDIKPNEDYLGIVDFEDLSGTFLINTWSGTEYFLIDSPTFNLPIVDVFSADYGFNYICGLETRQSDTVTIPCSGNGFIPYDTISIYATQNYDGLYTLLSGTGVNNLVIKHKHYYEDISADAHTRKVLSIGPDHDITTVQSGMGFHIPEGTYNLWAQNYGWQNLYQSQSTSIIEIIHGAGNTISGIQASSFPTDALLTNQIKIDYCYGVMSDTHGIGLTPGTEHYIYENPSTTLASYAGWTTFSTSSGSIVLDLRIPQCINKYHLGWATFDHRPAVFSLQGSLDGHAWDILDEQHISTFPDWFLCSNYKCYRYYQLYVNSTAGHGTLIIPQFAVVERVPVSTPPGLWVATNNRITNTSDWLKIKSIVPINTVNKHSNIYHLISKNDDGNWWSYKDSYWHEAVSFSNGFYSYWTGTERLAADDLLSAIESALDYSTNRMTSIELEHISGDMWTQLFEPGVTSLKFAHGFEAPYDELPSISGYLLNISYTYGTGTPVNITWSGNNSLSLVLDEEEVSDAIYSWIYPYRDYFLIFDIGNNSYVPENDIGPGYFYRQNYAGYNISNTVGYNWISSGTVLLSKFQEHSASYVLIPASGHGLNVFDPVYIRGTSYYDGFYIVGAPTTTSAVALPTVYRDTVFTTESKVGLIYEFEDKAEGAQIGLLVRFPDDSESIIIDNNVTLGDNLSYCHVELNKPRNSDEVIGFYGTESVGGADEILVSQMLARNTNQGIIVDDLIFTKPLTNFEYRNRPRYIFDTTSNDYLDYVDFEYPEGETLERYRFWLIDTAFLIYDQSGNPVSAPNGFPVQWEVYGSNDGVIWDGLGAVDMSRWGERATKYMSFTYDNAQKPWDDTGVYSYNSSTLLKLVTAPTMTSGCDIIFDVPAGAARINNSSSSIINILDYISSPYPYDITLDKDWCYYDYRVYHNGVPDPSNNQISFDFYKPTDAYGCLPIFRLYSHSWGSELSVVLSFFPGDGSNNLFIYTSFGTASATIVSEIWYRLVLTIEPNISNSSYSSVSLNLINILTNDAITLINNKNYSSAPDNFMPDPAYSDSCCILFFEPLMKIGFSDLFEYWTRDMELFSEDNTYTINKYTSFPDSGWYYNNASTVMVKYWGQYNPLPAGYDAWGVHPYIYVDNWIWRIPDSNPINQRKDGWTDWFTIEYPQKYKKYRFIFTQNDQEDHTYIGINHIQLIGTLMTVVSGSFVSITSGVGALDTSHVTRLVSVDVESHETSYTELYHSVSFDNKNNWYVYNTITSGWSNIVTNIDGGWHYLFNNSFVSYSGHDLFEVLNFAISIPCNQMSSDTVRNIDEPTWASIFIPSNGTLNFAQWFKGYDAASPRLFNYSVNYLAELPEQFALTTFSGGFNSLDRVPPSGVLWYEDSDHYGHFESASIQIPYGAAASGSISQRPGDIVSVMLPPVNFYDNDTPVGGYSVRTELWYNGEMDVTGGTKFRVILEAGSSDVVIDKMSFTYYWDPMEYEQLHTIPSGFYRTDFKPDLNLYWVNYDIINNLGYLTTDPVILPNGTTTTQYSGTYSIFGLPGHGLNVGDQITLSGTIFYNPLHPLMSIEDGTTTDYIVIKSDPYPGNQNLSYVSMNKVLTPEVHTEISGMLQGCFLFFSDESEVRIGQHNPGNQYTLPPHQNGHIEAVYNVGIINQQLTPINNSDFFNGSNNPSTIPLVDFMTSDSTPAPFQCVGPVAYTYVVFDGNSDTGAIIWEGFYIHLDVGTPVFMNKFRIKSSGYGPALIILSTFDDFSNPNYNQQIGYFDFPQASGWSDWQTFPTITKARGYTFYIMNIWAHPTDETQQILYSIEYVGCDPGTDNITPPGTFFAHTLDGEGLGRTGLWSIAGSYFVPTIPSYYSNNYQMLFSIDNRSTWLYMNPTKNGWYGGWDQIITSTSGGWLCSDSSLFDTIEGAFAWAAAQNYPVSPDIISDPSNNWWMWGDIEYWYTNVPIHIAYFFNNGQSNQPPAYVERISISGSADMVNGVVPTREITFNKEQSGCTIPATSTITSDFVDGDIAENKVYVMIMDFNPSTILITTEQYTDSSAWAYAEPNCTTTDKQSVAWDLNYYWQMPTLFRPLLKDIEISTVDTELKAVIPVNSQDSTAGDYVHIYGTENYDGIYQLLYGTTINQLFISAPYIEEVFYTASYRNLLEINGVDLDLTRNALFLTESGTSTITNSIYPTACPSGVMINTELPTSDLIDIPYVQQSSNFTIFSYDLHGIEPVELNDHFVLSGSVRLLNIEAAPADPDIFHIISFYDTTNWKIYNNGWKIILTYSGGMWFSSCSGTISSYPTFIEGFNNCMNDSFNHMSSIKLSYLSSNKFYENGGIIAGTDTPIYLSPCFNTQSYPPVGLKEYVFVYEESYPEAWLNYPDVCTIPSGLIWKPNELPIGWGAKEALKDEDGVYSIRMDNTTIECKIRDRTKLDSLRLYFVRDNISVNSTDIYEISMLDNQSLSLDWEHLYTGVNLFKTKYPLETIYTWAQLPNSGAPSARAFAVGIFDPINRQILIWGGQNDSGGLNDLWSYSVLTKNWVQLFPLGLLPSAFISTTNNYVGKFLRASAFYDSKEQDMVLYHPLEGLYKYSISENAWTFLSSEYKSIRSNIGMCLNSNSYVLIDDYILRNYNKDFDVWETISPKYTEWNAERFGSVFIYDPKRKLFYLTGGRIDVQDFYATCQGGGGGGGGGGGD